MDTKQQLDFLLTTYNKRLSAQREMSSVLFTLSELADSFTIKIDILHQLRECKRAFEEESNALYKKIEDIQAQCPHPQWVFAGNDHTHRYYECSVCKKMEDR